MKVFKNVNQLEADSQPPITKPVPMRPKEEPVIDDGNSRLADLSTVAKRLKVSKRFVQTLVRRKAIPVIKLGRRCTRFDLDSVMNAVKKFEIHEVR